MQPACVQRMLLPSYCWLVFSVSLWEKEGSQRIKELTIGFSGSGDLKIKWQLARGYRTDNEKHIAEAQTGGRSGGEGGGGLDWWSREVERGGGEGGLGGRLRRRGIGGWKLSKFPWIFFFFDLPFKHRNLHSFHPYVLSIFGVFVQYISFKRLTNLCGLQSPEEHGHGCCLVAGNRRLIVLPEGI